MQAGCLRSQGRMNRLWLSARTIALIGFLCQAAPVIIQHLYAAVRNPPVETSEQSRIIRAGLKHQSVITPAGQPLNIHN
jgi:hypothetical protein